MIPAKTITGYPDKLSVAPGDTLSFMVSTDSDAPDYRVQLVRLICTDDHPAGPGLVERNVESPINRSYPARRQVVRAGSCIVIPWRPALSRLASFTVQAMIWPTLPGKGRQTILAHQSPGGKAGFALDLDERGALSLRLADGRGGFHAVSTDRPLLARDWYLVAATFDQATRQVMLLQDPLVPGLGDHAGTQRSVALDGDARIACEAPLTIAARLSTAGPQPARQTAQHYNGKIDGPRLADRALTRAEIDQLRGPHLPPALRSDLVGFWDFSRGIDGEAIEDLSGNALHGETVNLPARAMKGWNWTGESHDWKVAPQHYGAIHFHDDDLYDAGWEADFALTIPPDLPSGVYAARLEDGGEPDHVVFFVRPAKGRPTARIAYLASTATYMAYANYRVMNCSALYEAFQGALLTMTPDDMLLNEHPEFGDSLYGLHSDGSGICYSSRLRPLLSLRPNAPLWSYNGDGYLTAWLDALGYAADVVTDEDLHAEGGDLLAPYSVVVTGCHPEYFTREMWDGVADYLRRGGRLMYLGGNGFYWRIAFHRRKPGVIEVRRAEDGTRAWAAEAGEYFMSFTGEYGGMWRRQDRTPNQLLGVGFTAQGFDIGSHYRRTAASFDPRAAFIFAGIGKDELIGNFGFAGDGAAGQELDRYERLLGSPPHALVVARSEHHNDNMLLATEEHLSTNLMLGGTENPKVHADIVFFETGAGGAVFSTGSISWCASLAWNGCDNNVSRLTRNVLDRFLEATPFA